MAKPNLKVEDLVLLEDREICRNEWPMGLETNVMASDDGKVERVEKELGYIFCQVSDSHKGKSHIVPWRGECL